MPVKPTSSDFEIAKALYNCLQPTHTDNNIALIAQIIADARQAERVRCLAAVTLVSETAAKDLTNPFTSDLATLTIGVCAMINGAIRKYPS